MLVIWTTAGLTLFATVSTADEKSAGVVFVWASTGAGLCATCCGAAEVGRIAWLVAEQAATKSAPEINVRNVRIGPPYTSRYSPSTAPSGVSESPLPSVDWE